MTDLQFEKFKNLIYGEFGNTVSNDKRLTLEYKIEKIIKRYHGGELTIDQFLKKLIDDGKESDTWQHFVDEITVHKTNFYREKDHFDFVTKNITSLMDDMPNIRQNREIRVWCAAASTGEEPYTIAMMLKEIMPPGYSIKLLATDISEKVLGKAITGWYPKDIASDIPKTLLEKYFDIDNGGYQVKDSLKEIITFRRFNLCDRFPFKNKFDIVFCRNVMIYFDDDLRIKIIKKIYDVMNPGGLFIFGLSESIGNKNMDLISIGSSMYRKKKLGE